MKYAIEGILNAPFGTLLIIAGLIWLTIAVFGKISGKIKLGRSGRSSSSVIILILISAGLTLSSCVNGPPEPIDCLYFDIDTVRLQESGGNWWVVDSGQMLYFEQNETEAREALSIIQHYRMNDQCFVGRPDPSLEYWLVDDASPTGSYPGEDCVGFNLNNIEVVNIDGNWKIVEGDHWILDFSDLEEEAQHSFEILQYYGFDNICFVGRPDASMTYFRQ